MKLDDPKLGFYLGLSHAGMMMVVPVGIGIYVDDFLGWEPWGVSIGVVVGFVSGLFYLLRALTKEEEK